MVKKKDQKLSWSIVFFSVIDLYFTVNTLQPGCAVASSLFPKSQEVQYLAITSSVMICLKHTEQIGYVAGRFIKGL